MSDVRTGQFTRTGGFGAPPRDPVQPRFHIEPVPDDAASAGAGRPIFRNEERVQFIMPGSPNQPVFRVSDEHKQRWPDQYAAFRRGEEMSVNGTPLEQWPILTRAMVLELKALSVFTVEQCAGLPDTAVQRIGRGGYGLRDRAKAYLDEADQLAFSERLNRENEMLNGQIAALQRKSDEQGILLERVTSQLMALQNAPNPIESHVPGEHDPFEALRQGRIAPVADDSALDTFATAKPRKGAKPQAEAA
jgi:hypothetical protein